MPSLRELHAAHGSLLLLDAAAARVQVGWLPADGSADWRSSDDEAGVGLFRCLEQLGRKPGDAGAFLFCDGPGSILGIRTSAMAIRTWNVLQPRPVFAYCSLALIARAIGRSDVSVIADARRNSWHQFTLEQGLRRVPPDALSGELVTPDTFRHWAHLPAQVRRYPYALDDLLPCVADADLFMEAQHPDAFMHEEPSYVKWSPQVHRAPEAK
jgi:tRNA threonylcarbamoyladenosine biosynthesis protein TsaB